MAVLNNRAKKIIELLSKYQGDKSQDLKNLVAEYKEYQRFLRTQSRSNAEPKNKILKSRLEKLLKRHPDFNSKDELDKRFNLLIIRFEESALPPPSPPKTAAPPLTTKGRAHDQPLPSEPPLQPPPPQVPPPVRVLSEEEITDKRDLPPPSPPTTEAPPLTNEVRERSSSLRPPPGRRPPPPRKSRHPQRAAIQRIRQSTGGLPLKPPPPKGSPPGMGLSEEKSAIKIQAGLRGHAARKVVKTKKIKHSKPPTKEPASPLAVTPIVAPPPETKQDIGKLLFENYKPEDEIQSQMINEVMRSSKYKLYCVGKDDDDPDRLRMLKSELNETISKFKETCDELLKYIDEHPKLKEVPQYKSALKAKKVVEFIKLAEKHIKTPPHTVEGMGKYLFKDKYNSRSEVQKKYIEIKLKSLPSKIESELKKIPNKRMFAKLRGRVYELKRVLNAAIEELDYGSGITKPYKKNIDVGSWSTAEEIKALAEVLKNIPDQWAFDINPKSEGKRLWLSRTQFSRIHPGDNDFVSDVKNEKNFIFDKISSLEVPDKLATEDENNLDRITELCNGLVNSMTNFDDDDVSKLLTIADDFINKHLFMIDLGMPAPYANLPVQQTLNRLHMHLQVCYNDSINYLLANGDLERLSKLEYLIDTITDMRADINQKKALSNFSDSVSQDMQDLTMSLYCASFGSKKVYCELLNKYREVLTLSDSEITNVKDLSPRQKLLEGLQDLHKGHTEGLLFKSDTKLKFNPIQHLQPGLEVAAIYKHLPQKIKKEFIKQLNKLFDENGRIQDSLSMRHEDAVKLAFVKAAEIALPKKERNDFLTSKKPKMANIDYLGIDDLVHLAAEQITLITDKKLLNGYAIDNKNRAKAVGTPQMIKLLKEFKEACREKEDPTMLLVMDSVYYKVLTRLGNGILPDDNEMLVSYLNEDVLKKIGEIRKNMIEDMPGIWSFNDESRVLIDRLLTDMESMASCPQVEVDGDNSKAISMIFDLKYKKINQQLRVIRKNMGLTNSIDGQVVQSSEQSAKYYDNLAAAFKKGDFNKATEIMKEAKGEGFESHQIISTNGKDLSDLILADPQVKDCFDWVENDYEVRNYSGNPQQAEDMFGALASEQSGSVLESHQQDGPQSTKKTGRVPVNSATTFATISGGGSGETRRTTSRRRGRGGGNTQSPPADTRSESPTSIRDIQNSGGTDWYSLKLKHCTYHNQPQTHDFAIHVNSIGASKTLAQAARQFFHTNIETEMHTMILLTLTNPSNAKDVCEEILAIQDNGDTMGPIEFDANTKRVLESTGEWSDVEPLIDQINNRYYGKKLDVRKGPKVSGLGNKSRGKGLDKKSGKELIMHAAGVETTTFRAQPVTEEKKPEIDSQTANIEKVTVTPVEETVLKTGSTDKHVVNVEEVQPTLVEKTTTPEQEGPENKEEKSVQEPASREGNTSRREVALSRKPTEELNNPLMNTGAFKLAMQKKEYQSKDHANEEVSGDWGEEGGIVPTPQPKPKKTPPTAKVALETLKKKNENRKGVQPGRIDNKNKNEEPRESSAKRKDEGYPPKGAKLRRDTGETDAGIEGLNQKAGVLEPDGDSVVSEYSEEDLDNLARKVDRIEDKLNEKKLSDIITQVNNIQDPVPLRLYIKVEIEKVTKLSDLELLHSKLGEIKEEDKRTLVKERLDSTSYKISMDEFEKSLSPQEKKTPVIPGGGRRSKRTIRGVDVDKMDKLLNNSFKQINFLQVYKDVVHKNKSCLNKFKEYIEAKVGQVESNDDSYKQYEDAQNLLVSLDTLNRGLTGQFYNRELTTTVKSLKARLDKVKLSVGKKKLSDSSQLDTLKSNVEQAISESEKYYDGNVRVSLNKIKEELHSPGLNVQDLHDQKSEFNRIIGSANEIPPTQSRSIR